MAGPRARQPDARRLTVVCHNVNGIRGGAKRRALLRAVTDGRYHVVILQETHTDPSDDVDGWLAAAAGTGAPWGGPAFWAHGRRGSRGVAVLLSPAFDGVNPSIEFTDYNDDEDARGRVLRVGWRDATTDDAWSMVAVYAPNGEADRRAFFAAGGPLARALAAGPAGANIVLAGDFNCILDPADTSAPASAVAEAAAGGATALRGLLAGAGLADTWLELCHRPSARRRRHPDGRFTHFPSLGASRRLDRAYVSDALIATGRLADCRHLPLGALPGDHAGVSITLDLGGAARLLHAPPRWRLDIDLLEDNAFITDVREEARCMVGRAGRNWETTATKGHMER